MHLLSNWRRQISPPFPALSFQQVPMEEEREKREFDGNLDKNGFMSQIGLSFAGHPIISPPSAFMRMICYVPNA
jgi:hypothetical protein